MQRSDSFLLNALVSFSGGLQDAYTYNVRDKVFANAQTGNIVLMSQNLMSGEWMRSLYYLCPVVAFAAGVFVAERIESAYKHSKKLHWRQIILLAEMLALFIVGFLPATMHLPANMLVSFACAMQLQSFRKLHEYGYASTMCIGNLRIGTENLSQYLRSHDKAALRKALHFFGIIFVFAVGAGLGGVLSGVFGLRTIWFSVAVLLVAAVVTIKEE